MSFIWFIFQKRTLKIYLKLMPGLLGVFLLSGCQQGPQSSLGKLSSHSIVPTQSFNSMTMLAQSSRVAAGAVSAYTDSQGSVWSQDTGFSGGTVYSTARSISGTSDPTLYQRQRYGNFSYSFNEPAGSYVVKLRFAEIYWTSPGQRVFNVSINGQQVLSNFDIAGTAGAFTALDKTFPVTLSSSGPITIQFTTITDNASINAIEVDPLSSSSAVVAVHSGGSAYVDSSGLSWAADSGFSGGYTYATTSNISQTSDPKLYQSQRYGNDFLYTFNVSNGNYDVKLKFAEIYWTQTNQRVFNVAINGQTVLSNFDIVASAGGAFAAVDKVFPVSVTSGQISIHFTTITNNASINAIELLSSGSSAAPPPPPPVSKQKYLILHDMGGPGATPDFINTHRDYLSTLPFDGLAVYPSGNINFFQPSEITSSSISNMLAPIANNMPPNLSQNFLTVFYGPGWSDLYNDAEWAQVAKTMANLGQALKTAGLKGIFFDNENYGRYGNYGDPTCGSPHTLIDCQSQMVARGNQMMQALQTYYPDITILFFWDAFGSDATYSFPNYNNVWFANQLVGPFEVGFVQGKGPQATVISGGENDGVFNGTAQEYNTAYQYLKYGMVNDVGVPCDNLSRTAGCHGYVPPSIRAIWSSLVSGGTEVYEPLTHDSSGNPTLATPWITNAMARSDKYVWMYIEVCDATRPFCSLLWPPNSPPSYKAAPQSYLDAVRAGWQAGKFATAP